MTAQHRFSRIELLTGKTGLARLAQASIAVFGIGGVGSYAVEALARAGIGQLTLVDFDDICQTNINRQIHALEQTIGKPKVLVMAERCRAINPAIQVEPCKAFYCAENADTLLNRNFDYVLDCIDHITAKLHLIQHCKALGLPIIASMGAANKIDPTRIVVADLARTEGCRLARVMRKELRKRGIACGVKVVYSTEGFRPLDEHPAAATDPCLDPALPDQGGPRSTRRVVLGSSSYIPPIFGLTMAGEVIRDLLGEGN